jgi:hypothetical protein
MFIPQKRSSVPHDGAQQKQRFDDLDRHSICHAIIG